MATSDFSVIDKLRSLLQEYENQCDEHLAKVRDLEELIGDTKADLAAEMDKDSPDYIECNNRRVRLVGGISRVLEMMPPITIYEYYPIRPDEDVPLFDGVESELFTIKIDGFECLDSISAHVSESMLRVNKFTVYRSGSRLERLAYRSQTPM